MNETDFNVLIVCAVRYALGRRTYIVSEVTDIAKKNIHSMEPCTKKVIIDSIQGTENLGDFCDRQKWEELLKLLKISM